jgi:hypothetical protein
LQHVSTLQGHLQAIVHQLKLPHCVRFYSNASYAIAYRRRRGAVSIGEQFPEDGLVRPKHVVIECDFSGILKQRRDCKQFWVALETEMSERVMNE